MIRIIYETTEDGTSAQFLEKEQTLGKNHSFFFTQSALISGRSLFPCQDTPAIKFGHHLKIIVPSDLVGMISGIYQEKEDIVEEDGQTVNYTGYVYELKEPIPSYLLALAAGNIQKKSINDQITIYGEEAILADAYEELKDDLPKALQLSIQYLGDYKWEQFNILILPTFTIIVLIIVIAGVLGRSFVVNKKKRFYFRYSKMLLLLFLWELSKEC